MKHAASNQGNPGHFVARISISAIATNRAVKAEPG